MAMGDPANEPGNPDGCRISKKKISKMASSLTNLADMFSRAATLIETAVSSIASSVKKVGKGTGKSGGGGGGVKDTITTPEEFNRSVKRIKKAQEKKEKAAAKEIYEANMASMRAERDAREAEEEEIIENTMRLLRALNNSIKKAEKEAAAEASREEKEIIKSAMRGLSARNAIRDRAEKEAEKAAQEEENEIIRNAMRGLSARNAIRQASEKEMEARKKFFEDQERDIMRQAPVAYSIGKALGFISGKIFRTISGLSVQGRASGGWIQAFASGGAAKGTDTVPAMLTPGEFVVNRKSAQKNRGILRSINDGTQYYAAGGYVGAMGRGVDTARRGAGAAISGVSAGFESAGLSSLISGLQKLNGVVGTAATGFRTVSAAVTGGLQAFNGVVGAAATGFKVLAASALAPVDMFNKLVGFAGSFVEAVNPALMQQLSLAFKDLQAVIGMGLQPIIAAAIPIIRAFADKLQPVMQALMPTFDQLAQSMISLSGPVITLLIEAFAALEPVIALISSAIEIWAGILTAVAPIISTVFKEIVYRITSLGTTLQWLVGKIMSWIPGTGDAGKKMMASADAAQRSADAYYAGTSKVQQAVKAEVKPGAAAGAAAKSASFSGISDFGKNLMQQAFSSSTQAAALKTAEYSEKTYTELTKMNAQMGRANPAAPAAGVRRGAA